MKKHQDEFLIALNQMRLKSFIEISNEFHAMGRKLTKVSRRLGETVVKNHGLDCDKMESTADNLEKVVRKNISELRDLLTYLESQVDD